MNEGHGRSGRCLECGKKSGDATSVTCGNCGSALSFGDCMLCGTPSVKERVFLRAARYDFVGGAYRVRWREHPLLACETCVDHVRDDDFKRLLASGLLWIGIVLSLVCFGLVIVFDLPKALVFAGAVFLLGGAYGRIFARARIDGHYARFEEKSDALRVLAQHLSIGLTRPAVFTLTASPGEKLEAR
jgi:hypothetical protein